MNLYNHCKNILLVFFFSSTANQRTLLAAKKVTTKTVPPCTLPRHIPQLSFYANSSLKPEDFENGTIERSVQERLKKELPGMPENLFYFAKKRSEFFASLKQKKTTDTLFSYLLDTGDTDPFFYALNRHTEQSRQGNVTPDTLTRVTKKVKNAAQGFVISKVLEHLACCAEDETKSPLERQDLREQLLYIANNLSQKLIHPSLFETLLAIYPTKNYAEKLTESASLCGRTPLHICAMVGTYEAMENLLKEENMKDVIEVQDGFGYTPLQLAALYGNEGTVNALLKHDAHIKSYFEAVNSGNTRIVDIFRNYLAKYTGNDTTMKNLKKQGLNTDNHCIRPLHLAIENSDFDMIYHLFTQCDAQASLKKTLRNGSLKKMTEPIFYATKKIDPTILRFLLKNGSSVEDKSYGGDTPLHWAAKYGNYEAVRILLEAGSDVNAIGSGGMSVLERTIEAKHYELAKIFIEMVHANINNTTFRSSVPFSTLDRAIQANCPKEFIDYLRDHGAKTAKELEAEKAAAKEDKKTTSDDDDQHEQDEPSEASQTGMIAKRDPQTPVYPPHILCPLISTHDRKSSKHSLEDVYSFGDTENKQAKKAHLDFYGYKEDQKNIQDEVQTHYTKAFYQKEVRRALQEGDYTYLNNLLESHGTISDLYTVEENPLLALLTTLKETYYTSASILRFSKNPHFIKEKNDFLKTAEILIEYCDTEEINYYNYHSQRTPLVLAIEIGEVSLVKLLLDKGARTNGPSALGMDPLSVAERLLEDELDGRSERETIYSLLNTAR